MEKFVVLLVKKMLGLDRGADDDSKMEERLSYWLARPLNEVEVGVNHWARLRFGGGGQLWTF